MCVCACVCAHACSGAAHPRTLGHQGRRAAAHARHGVVDRAEVDRVPVAQQLVHLQGILEDGARCTGQMVEGGQTLERQSKSASNFELGGLQSQRGVGHALNGVQRRVLDLLGEHASWVPDLQRRRLEKVRYEHAEQPLRFMPARRRKRGRSSTIAA